MMKKIVICATQRSGSTMICEDIALTGALGLPDEHFNRWWAHHDLDWPAEAADLLRKGSTGNGVFSTKIMGNQVCHVDERLSTFVQPHDAAPLPHLRAFFGDALWVWVRRQDSVGQAISNCLAQKTGVYHLTRKKSPLGVAASAIDRRSHATLVRDTNVTFKEVMASIDWLKKYDLIWDVFFKQNRLQPLTLWYEDFTDTSAAPVIAEAAGLPVADVKPRTLRKLAGGPTAEVRQEFASRLMTLETRSLHSRYRKMFHALPEPARSLGERVRHAVRSALGGF